MKNLKKIAAVALTAAMVLSMTGCAGGKLSSSKLKTNIKDYGAEECKEADDLVDLIEDRDLEDGAYFTGDSDGIKDILKSDNNWGLDDFYDKSIKNGTVFALLNEDDAMAAFVFSFTFSNKKDAEAYYEDVVGDIDDDEDFDVDDGEEGGVVYTIAELEDYYYNACAGVYQSGNTVMIIFGVTGDDLDDVYDVVDEIVDGYDIVLPSEV